MTLKVVRTIFLALGLVMVWLGFFVNYELKKQPEIVEGEEFEMPYGELELYTLADEQYDEDTDALSQLELKPQHITDFSFPNAIEESVSEHETAVPHQAGEWMPAAEENQFTEDQEQLVQEGSVGELPLILAVAGTVFLLFGVAVSRIKGV